MEILEEFVETLKSFKIKLPDDMVKGWKKLLIENSIIVKPVIKLDVIKEDIDDNKFLEAGISGNADLIISQDKHLLKLKSYHGINIISPKEALSFIK